MQTEKNPRGKVAGNTNWSGKKICTGRMQGSGWKIVGNEFRQVEVFSEKYEVFSTGSETHSLPV